MTAPANPGGLPAGSTGRGRLVRAEAAAVAALVFLTLILAATDRPRAGREARAMHADPLPARGASQPALMVVLDGLTWPWLARYGMDARHPHLRALLQHAALAAYNPLAEPQQPATAYLTAATGTGVTVTGPVQLAEGPRAQAVLFRRTGHRAPGGAAAVVNVPRLAAQSRRSGSFTPPGWLGEALSRAGVRLAVWGDGAWVSRSAGVAVPEGFLETSPLALAALLAMDRSGAVPQVRLLSEEDPARPGGLRTRWEAIPALVRAMGPGPWLAVVASGDLWRIEAEAEELSDMARELHYRRLAADLERLLAHWMGEGPGRAGGSFLLVGLLPGPRARWTGERLTALAWAGPWGPGLWVGGTTRRAGLVTALDLAPTLARAAGAAAPAGAVGRPLAAVARTRQASGHGPPEPLPEVAQLVRFTRDRAAILAHRFDVLPPLTTLQVLALAAVAARIGLQRLGRPGGPGAGWAPLLAAWAAAVPLALLHPWAAVPFLPGLDGPAWSVPFVAVVALAIAWAARTLARPYGLSGTALVCGAIAAVLLADQAAGLDLVARSFMGYDLTAGARFYGIGNEHMGLWVGSSLALAGELADRWRAGSVAGLGLLLLVAAVVAAPNLGANVGGAATCAAAFAVALQAWWGFPAPGHQGSARRVLLGLVAAAGLVAAITLWDLRLGPQAETHLARTVAITRAVGPSYPLEVAVRKLALNGRLIRYSLYSRVAAVATLVVAAALWRGAGPLFRGMGPRPALRVALEAAAVGALVALVANDSGITAAATALLGPAALVLEQAAGEDAEARPAKQESRRKG